MSDSGKAHTSSPAVLGALLFITARSLDSADVPGTPASADPAQLSPADRDILAEVELALAAQSEGSDSAGEPVGSAQTTGSASAVTSTLAEVAAAIAYVRGRAEIPSLTASRYDVLRKTVLGGLGAASVKGATVWPPTSQTAVQRFGSWNEALKSAGLATNKIGRAKGQLRFDAAAYDKAIGEFLADCESRGLATTYKSYTDYAAEHKGEVPSAAAVRKFYGSWNAALAAVG
ncbi:homing endonuclease associated repeat-containing protein [Brevibacterium oceani]|uniref:homing endonuclease associated repeat-containing protein n=1 Tax=Brevibacterium oceani TaxID=358099 RepID=UPI002159F747|nr:multidrug transporter [Brevibacterium oceani]